jgi:hypothetical protein
MDHAQPTATFSHKERVAIGQERDAPGMNQTSRHRHDADVATGHFEYL